MHSTYSIWTAMHLYINIYLLCLYMCVCVCTYIHGYLRLRAPRRLNHYTIITYLKTLTVTNDNGAVIRWNLTEKTMGKSSERFFFLIYFNSVIIS